MSKLALYTPGRELVDAYLYEIARGYGMNWVPDPGPDVGKKGKEGPSGVEDNNDRKADEGDHGDSLSGPGEGQQKEAVAVLGPVKDTGPVMPTAPTYPTGQEKDAWSGGEAGTGGKSGSTGAGAGASGAGGTAGGVRKLSEEEELAQRFERLKNLR